MRLDAYAVSGTIDREGIPATDITNAAIFNVEDMYSITQGVTNGVITNLYGLYVSNMTPRKEWNNDHSCATNSRGIGIMNQGGAVNNTNLLIGTGADGNWSIYNNSGYDNYFAGNLGIGTDDTQGYKLFVNGDAYVNGTLWYTAEGLWTSDERYKEDIKTIESPLNKILNMRGVSYNWRKEEYKDKGFSEGRHYGVIGQEVEKVLPEIVKEDADGYKGVAYTEMVPVLIEAIKEQQKIIEELKAEVRLLKNKDLMAGTR